MIPLGLYRTIEVNLRVYNESNIGFKKSKSENGPEASLIGNKKDDVLKLINYVVTNPE